MTTLHRLTAPEGSRHRKKRVGRGQGSGHGKTAGRGGKGQKARTGNMHFEGFEGGQMPLQRRLPKFGFNSPNRISYQGTGIKILGNGTLSKKLTVKAHKFSAGARAAIENAGGAVEELPLVSHRQDSAARAHGGKGVRPAKPSAGSAKPPPV